MQVRSYFAPDLNLQEPGVKEFILRQSIYIHELLRCRSLETPSARDVRLKQWPRPTEHVRHGAVATFIAKYMRQHYPRTSLDACPWRLVACVWEGYDVFALVRVERHRSVDSELRRIFITTSADLHPDTHTRDMAVRVMAVQLPDVT